MIHPSRMIEGHASYQRSHRPLEIAGLVTFAVLTLLLGARVVLGARNVEGAWLVLLASLVVGYFLADMASGFVHWLFDQHGSVDTPIFGPNCIRPFREHHDDPTDITRHDFIETNGNSAIGVSPIMLAVCIIPIQSWIALLFSSTMLVVSVGVVATNQFHKWAHSTNPPRVARWLQRARIILHPEHHAVHHTPPYDTYYCITSGWLNAPIHWLRGIASKRRNWQEPTPPV